jgi:hypothetical protein
MYKKFIILKTYMDQLKKYFTRKGLHVGKIEQSHIDFVQGKYTEPCKQKKENGTEV